MLLLVPPLDVHLLALPQVSHGESGVFCTISPPRLSICVRGPRPMIVAWSLCLIVNIVQVFCAFLKMYFKLLSIVL